MGVFDAEGRYGIFIHSDGSLVTRGVTSPSNAIGAGVWTHLAVTEAASTLTFYVNGTTLATMQNTAAIATNNLGAEIAGNVPPGDRLLGAIDELRVYSRALSPSEIAQLAN
jgi:Concanavalin A-like lectin/glucanases superfamily